MTSQDFSDIPLPTEELTETEIKDARSSLRLLADAMPQLVWSTRPDGFHDYFNQKWYEFTGAALEQSEGAGWSQLLHPDDLPRTIDRWQLALQTGEPYEIEYRFKRASDGAYRWFLARALPIKDAAGRTLRWFGTCTDIDDQKRAELEMVRLTERERHIADALQGMVQPTMPDTIPGLDLASFYRVALQEANVGGDFYDVFALEKGCYALIVGDLSGKGLAAAAQVGTLRNMLRFALYTGNTLAEAVTRLNNVLIANDLLSGFATLVVAAFDLPMKSLTYVSCGQEPGLLRRSAGGDVSELPPTGPVIGMNEAASYQEHVIPLAPGDTFALYTDGLTEAGPNRRELLGVSGLAALLHETGGTSRKILDYVVAGAEAYAGGVFHDDVCMLVGTVIRSNGNV